MENIHVDDIDLLNSLENDISNIREEIENLPAVKKLREREIDKKNLRKKIIKYSTYDVEQIGRILANLMTFFEGKTYCLKNDDWRYDYSIKIEEYTENDVFIYDFFGFNKIELEVSLTDYFSGIKPKDKCILPPSNFYSNSVQKKSSYVQVFLNYLYQRRSQKSLEKITDEELNEILKDFLKISTSLQIQRKKEIKKKIEELILGDNKRKFEKSCVIDRNLIFNAIMYIVNRCEENMNGILEEDESWRNTSDKYEGTSYQILKINYDNKRCCSFKAIVDTITCDYDTYAYPLTNKKSNICFFDLKWNLEHAIKKSIYLADFMSSIEQMYYEKKDITIDDVASLLAVISNKSKSKQKLLKTIHLH